MLNQVAAAFDRKDYSTAARLVKEWLHQSPENPWAQLYAARLQEVAGNLDQAQMRYRHLLRDVTHPKLLAQVRQGLQRLEQPSESKLHSTVARQQPDDLELGCLVLEAVPSEATAIVQSFAQVVKLDAYTARMLLPNRGWKLYRTGPVAELHAVGQALQAARVPVVWAAFSKMQAIRVFQVNHFQSFVSSPTVVCQDEQNRQGVLSFEWSEVRQRVEGRLPIFEQVLELGYRDRLERKESIQDYAHICDLHLPKRGCILRMLDSGYEFDRGASVLPQRTSQLDRTTLRTHWNALIHEVQARSPEAIVWSDFPTFGETAADFAAPLSRLAAHIAILRQVDTYWDPAFELYSRLAFLRRL
ncbi:tetratricopeptide repeat protein [Leptolyngbya sp. FACHB-36]|uniref:tetratricopeptide repeat protein n=1 Tax=Leptolyngbya sp. FACHB-36 TaxID=2692808 RepID=UPI00168077B9|nr:tetratricopeptide repeat protein [Leptolyngbya sp. FACHB-36]MBD2022079.1 tetratricopeptide repeat protein [Leptolyngbya sp. FACHB-36]